MAVQSIIVGTIDGISRVDYERIKDDLNAVFQQVVWKNDTLFIHSSQKHANIKEVATKIAERIGRGKYGSLLYIGNKRVVCIYLGHCRFVGKPYREPLPPEWWGAASP